jgi:hypothetical protein
MLSAVLALVAEVQIDPPHRSIMDRLTIYRKLKHDHECLIY